MRPPKTHTEAVRQIAKQYGYNKRNQFYVDKCMETFGIEIGSSTISRAIGIFTERMYRRFPNDVQSEAEIAAKTLLKATDNDISVARRVLERAFDATLASK